MSFLNSVLKVFVGDKSKQDVKAITPLVNKIKTFEAAIEALSHDELRAKTLEFKAAIAEANKAINEKIKTLLAEAEATDDIDVLLLKPDTRERKRVLLSGRPILNTENEVIAAVVTIKDISKYKMIEKELKKTELKYRKLIGFKKDIEEKDYEQDNGEEKE